ncbi:MAG: Trk system potassium transporter TrkA [Eubacteriales bacterium]|nr:Trk system potassium transporter TrkA [Eubacteriales bacterium]
MNIVIGGAGKVGALIIEELAAEGHELILIEKNREVLETALDKNDIAGVLGSAASVSNLEEAGVAEADFYIAATENDETNMVSAIIAKRLGAERSLARVRNPEYSSQMSFIRDSLGINQLINPELEAAREIGRLLKYPAALSLEAFANGRALLIELELPAKSPLVGLSLPAFRERHPGLLIAAITRAGEVSIPSGRDKLAAGDRLLFFGNGKNLDALYRDFGQNGKPERRAMVIGGGRLTHYLLKMMQESSLRFTVIEQKASIAEELAGYFPEHEIILGDGTDYSFLAEHSLDSVDVFLALTGVDEENILTSLYAKKMGVPRYITKVNRTAILKILANNELQAVITPKRIIADYVLRLVRAAQNSQGSNVEALHRISNNQLEALEFSVKADAALINTPLAQLKIKKDCLIALILRGNELIFPAGKDCILPGDHIVVISLRDYFQDVDDILEAEN